MYAVAISDCLGACTGEDIITIPGTKRIKNLEENIASEKVSLTAEDLQSIEKIMPAGSVSGTRYPEKFMSSLDKAAWINKCSDKLIH